MAHRLSTTGLPPARWAMVCRVWRGTVGVKLGDDSAATDAAPGVIEPLSGSRVTATSPRC
ncbi:MAG: hypothetical protein ACK55I_42345 [bacterium]